MPKHVFLLAEYCDASFFMGWWLYERDTNDGRPNRSGKWGWMQETWARSQQEKARNLCVRMGYAPPKVERYRQNFAKWFAGTFPNGLLVQKRGRYKLIERVARRPRQQKGVIRTIRGANRAFEQHCR